MREDLKSRILQRAKSKVRELGYNLTSVAEDDLEEFINQGVDRMTSMQYYSETDRIRAERNIETLIERMSTNAKSRSLTESLDYRSFSIAKASICPLWPFC
ncbi:hypothetical protein [Abyssalbus ytuae]|uniref:Uncharacterized protein n=1 Tax=Abyssalbus ytuae TaxID=2926907 RepID=A0A9E7D0J5_9FLAO|nr:hypothetical protein [Abyssalbus ytuae]UOB18475.1 hypothetical protein MQE35_04085 [Abyssalbus ytuae]